jgi:hypothetical protein
VRSRANPGECRKLRPVSSHAVAQFFLVCQLNSRYIISNTTGDVIQSRQAAVTGLTLREIIIKIRCNSKFVPVTLFSPRLINFAKCEPIKQF